MLIEHVQGATVYGFQAVQKVPMVPRLVSTTIRRAPIGDAGVVNWQVHLRVTDRPAGGRRFGYGPTRHPVVCHFRVLRR